MRRGGRNLTRVHLHLPGEFDQVVTSAAKARGVTRAAMYRKIVKSFVENEMRSEGMNPRPQDELEAFPADDLTPNLGEW
jgi:hypothetical protein